MNQPGLFRIVSPFWASPPPSLNGMMKKLECEHVPEGKILKLIEKEAKNGSKYRTRRTGCFL